MVDCLIPDVLRFIFSLLDRKDWFNVQLVCRNWHEQGKIAFPLDSEDNKALEWAARTGNKTFLYKFAKDPNVDLAALRNLLIFAACKFNMVDLVRDLINNPRVNPGTHCDICLRTACELGNIEIVKLLLQSDRVNPTSDLNRAMKLAYSNGHLEICKLLQEDGRCEAITVLKRTKPKSPFKTFVYDVYNTYTPSRLFSVIPSWMKPKQPEDWNPQYVYEKVEF